jgi:hypothetical protein
MVCCFHTSGEDAKFKNSDEIGEFIHKTPGHLKCHGGILADKLIIVLLRGSMKLLDLIKAE